MFRYPILSLVFIAGLFSVYGQNDTAVFDSIQKYRTLSSSNNFDLNQRLQFAKKAVNFSNITKIDSTILYSNRQLSFIYLLMDNYEPYREINYKNLKLSTKLKDTSSLAVVNNNLGYYHYQEAKSDSAFYYYSKALKYFTHLNSVEDEYKILINIADIQETEKDYVGSEENAIRAIKIVNSLPMNEDHLDNLWTLNNLIGITSLKLKAYERAIEYHNKALEYADQMRDGYYNRLYSLNNLAEVYKTKGDIEKSIKLYENVVKQKDVYIEYDPSFYAIALANLAFTKSLKKENNLEEIRAMFYEAKNVSDTLDDKLAQTGISIDLARFYTDLEEKDSALFYAERSRKLAKESTNNELLLKSLYILSELKGGEEGKIYLRRHIKLADSLLNVERNARNRNARLELETDELEAENEQISRENLYLAILSIGLLLTVILIYVVISQRANNRKLKLQQVQQKANEDIYNLMLGQQDKVDEARTIEKKRISEELHDGVLGRLFGTRLSLDSINFKDGKEAMMTRANYISQLKTIEEDIRKISHELNTDFVSGTGFMDIVSELIENQTQAYGLKYDFEYTDDISWDIVSNKAKINIYRIIQESMQNIYKHANAKSIKISISLKNDVICLDIKDDGDGFDTS
ncbi:tetratricopeptide repeat-containing sensor histidine kinase, partial [Winogradskyella sp.]|uniref:tetratricopeptide repeat-containing sensor histidine kinase n=1 Tax=Winogradskyella sp. TaxID=1883156 RepID=UPI003F6AE44D